jgi:hypothetical protein
MHAKRPEGSASIRDLLALWGPLWAKLQRQPWDEDVLDNADPLNTEPGADIAEFAERIERHTGLLVERAPRRWGFPHLTFEEFYTGRSLAFEGKASARPAAIRAHLHDPRYLEPILLALGLLGRDQPEELEEVFDAAVLATGSEAERLHLAPSAWEDLLGRDLRFALRALADDVPASPQTTDALLSEALDDVLMHNGRGRFRPYREAVFDAFGSLAGVSAGSRLATLFADRQPRDDSQLRDYVRLLGLVGSRQLVSAASVMDRLIRHGNDDLTLGAAEALAAKGVLTLEAWKTVLHALQGKQQASAMKLLTQTAQLHPDVIAVLTEVALNAADDQALSAAELLKAKGALDPRVLSRLNTMVSTAVGVPLVRAATVLNASAALSGEGIERVVESGKHDRSVHGRIVKLLTEGHVNHNAIDSVVEMAIGDGGLVARLAADCLTAAPGAAERTVDRLCEIALSAPDAEETGAVAILQYLPNLPSRILDRLRERVNAGTASEVIRAATVLGRQGVLPMSVLDRLTEVMRSADAFTAMRASDVLGSQREIPAWAVRQVNVIALQRGGVVGGEIQRRARTKLERAVDHLKDPHAEDSSIDDLRWEPTLPASVIERLVDVVATSGDWHSVAEASRLLAGQALPDDQLLRLRDVAAGATSPHVAVVATEILGAGEQLSPAMAARLKGIASGNSDVDLVIRATRQLAVHGSDVTDLYGRIESLVERSADPAVIVAASRTLALSAPLPESVLTRLQAIATLEDGSWTAASAMSVLVQVGAVSDTVREFIIAAASNPKLDLVARLRAVDSLVIDADRCDLTAILASLLEDQSSIMRVTASHALVALGAGNAALRSNLIDTAAKIVRQAITKGEDLDVREAYEMLWSLSELET